MKEARAAGALVPAQILVFHHVGGQIAVDRWLMTLANTRGRPPSIKHAGMATLTVTLNCRRLPY